MRLRTSESIDRTGGSRTPIAKYGFLLLCLVGIPASGARAQAGNGIVEGRLVNKTDAAKVPAGAELEVISLAGGMNVLKTAAADAAGKFRIDGLPTGDRLMIRATYKTVTYHQFAAFDTSGRAQVEVAVYEVAESMKGVKFTDVRIGFQVEGPQLRCLESYSIDNQTSPPVTVVMPDGNFRFSKAPGITDMPGLSVLAPGASFPLTDSPLESADGKSYYSLYPLRPGITTFEVEQSLPYQNRTYAYRKTFYEDLDGVNIGVIPQDMVISGDGITRIQTDAQRNFAVYRSVPLKAGAEIVWSLTGGTAMATPAAMPENQQGESRVTHMPNTVGQNALVLGPLVLMGFIAVLWYALNLKAEALPHGQDPRIKMLKDRREQLISYLAALDHRFENNILARRDYSRLREQGLVQLRRVIALLGKK